MKKNLDEKATELNAIELDLKLSRTSSGRQPPASGYLRIIQVAIPCNKLHFHARRNDCNHKKGSVPKAQKLVLALWLWLLVWVPASWAQAATMPELYGLTEQEATKRLIDTSFVGKIHVQKTPGKECDRKQEKPDAVCGQTPTPGAQQAANLDVWVFIQEGRPVSVARFPVVRFQTEAQARERLARAGFTGIITTKTMSYSECPQKALREGTVCGASPDDLATEGLRQKAYPSDTDIVLYLMGSYRLDDAFGLVPDVIGLSLLEAVKKLDEQGFTSVSVRFVELVACKTGEVCSTGPEKGVPTRRGPSMVSLIVATRYPGPMRRVYGANGIAVGYSERMPDLTGDTIDQAWNKLDALGVGSSISIKLDQRQCIQNVQPGLVCGQSPELGSKLEGAGREYSNPMVLFVHNGRLQ